MQPIIDFMVSMLNIDKLKSDFPQAELVEVDNATKNTYLTTRYGAAPMDASTTAVILSQEFQKQIELTTTLLIEFGFDPNGAMTLKQKFIGDYKSLNRYFADKNSAISHDLPVAANIKRKIEDIIFVLSTIQAEQRLNLLKQFKNEDFICADGTFANLDSIFRKLSGDTISLESYIAEAKSKIINEILKEKYRAGEFVEELEVAGTSYENHAIASVTNCLATEYGLAIRKPENDVYLIENIPDTFKVKARKWIDDSMVNSGGTLVELVLTEIMDRLPVAPEQDASEDLKRFFDTQLNDFLEAVRIGGSGDIAETIEVLEDGFPRDIAIKYRHNLAEFIENLIIVKLNKTYKLLPDNKDTELRQMKVKLVRDSLGDDRIGEIPEQYISELWEFIFKHDLKLNTEIYKTNAPLEYFFIQDMIIEGKPFLQTLLEHRFKIKGVDAHIYALKTLPITILNFKAAFFQSLVYDQNANDVIPVLQALGVAEERINQVSKFSELLALSNSYTQKIDDEKLIKLLEHTSSWQLLSSVLIYALEVESADPRIASIILSKIPNEQITEFFRYTGYFGAQSKLPYTLIDYAILKHYNKLVKFILEHNFVNKESLLTITHDKIYNDSFCTAILYNNKEALRLLLLNTSSPQHTFYLLSRKSQENKNALEYAYEKSSQDLFFMILDSLAPYARFRILEASPILFGNYKFTMQLFKQAQSNEEKTFLQTRLIPHNPAAHTQDIFSKNNILNLTTDEQKVMYEMAVCSYTENNIPFLNTLHKVITASLTTLRNNSYYHNTINKLLYSLFTIILTEPTTYLTKLTEVLSYKINPDGKTLFQLMLDSTTIQTLSIVFTTPNINKSDVLTEIFKVNDTPDAFIQLLSYAINTNDPEMIGLITNLSTKPIPSRYITNSTLVVDAIINSMNCASIKAIDAFIKKQNYHKHLTNYNSFKETALHTAIRTRSLEVVETIISLIPQLNRMNIIFNKPRSASNSILGHGIIRKDTTPILEANRNFQECIPTMFTLLSPAQRRTATANLASISATLPDEIFKNTLAAIHSIDAAFIPLFKNQFGNQLSETQKQIVANFTPNVEHSFKRDANNAQTITSLLDFQTKFGSEATLNVFKAFAIRTNTFGTLIATTALDTEPSDEPILSDIEQTILNNALENYASKNSNKKFHQHVTDAFL